MGRIVNHAAILALRLLEAEEDGWIGVDLDGTLAKYTGWKGLTHIGEPIPKMVARVRRWVGRGKKVKIFTARADDEKSVNAIKKWLKKHDLPDLEVTNLKDKDMVELWDDRAVAVKKNTGEVKEALNRRGFLRTLGRAAVATGLAGPMAVGGATAAAPAATTAAAAAAAPAAAPCISCGAPAVHACLGLLAPHCDDCYQKLLVRWTRDREEREKREQEKQRKARRHGEPGERSRLDYAGGSEDVGYSVYHEALGLVRFLLA